MDAIGHGFEQMFEELPGRSPGGLVDQPADSELARAIDADAQVKLTFCGLPLRDIRIKKPMGYRMKRWGLGLSPSLSGKREMPWRCRQRCSADRVRCKIEGCRA
jgi:hypothetical protein